MRKGRENNAGESGTGKKGGKWWINGINVGKVLKVQ